MVAKGSEATLDDAQKAKISKLPGLKSELQEMKKNFPKEVEASEAKAAADAKAAAESKAAAEAKAVAEAKAAAKAKARDEWVFSTRPIRLADEDFPDEHLTPG